MLFVILGGRLIQYPYFPLVLFFSHFLCLNSKSQFVLVLKNAMFVYIFCKLKKSAQTKWKLIWCFSITVLFHSVPFRSDPKWKKCKWKTTSIHQDLWQPYYQGLTIILLVPQPWYNVDRRKSLGLQKWYILILKTCVFIFIPSILH